MTTKLGFRYLLLTVTCAAVTVTLATPSALAPPPGGGPPGHGGGGHGGGGGGGNSPPTTIYSPVILTGALCQTNLLGFYTGRGGCNHTPVIITPDGQDLAFVLGPSTDGDVTRGGGTRYVVDFCCDTGTPCPSGDPYPEYGGCGGTESIVVTSDDCLQGSPSNSAVLFGNAHYYFPLSNLLGGTQLRWSPDGTRLAFSAQHVGVEEGIYVGEVLFDADGKPDGLWDGETVDGSGDPVPNTIRLVYPAPELPRVRWSGDNARVSFWLPDPVTGKGDVWILDVDTEVAANVTSTPDVDERDAALSPVAGDNRVIYSRLTVPDPGGNGSNDRRELIVLDLDTMIEDQITNDQNTHNIAFMRQPDWSPDAQDVVFSAGGIFSDITETGIFRVPADGSAKAKRLTRPKVIDGSIGNNITWYPRWRD